MCKPFGTEQQMPLLRILSTFLLLCSCFLLPAQDVQWASHVIAFSSQSGKTAYSAKQVLGEPTKLPASGDCGCAWAAEEKPNTFQEYIKVGFAQAQKVRQIFIGESYNPGSITKIWIYDYQNREELIYERTEKPDLSVRGRLFSLEIPKTKFKVSALRIQIDPHSVPGSNQIDAIGLSASKKEPKINIELAEDFPIYGKPVDPGPHINSIYSEVMPRFSVTGDSLFFDRKDHPQNYGGFINDDIWLATADAESEWTPPENFRLLNNEHHNYVCGISQDGVLTLANHYYPDGTSAPGISQTFRSGKRYIAPLNMEVKDLYTGGLYAEYFMNRQRNVLLLAIQPLNSLGGKDLYVSFSEDGMSWSEPKNLGSSINTAAHEMAPSLSEDGSMLFFSSNGHRGYGDQDIFVAYRLDDSWENWSSPKNLGPIVNSPGWESHFVMHPNSEYAYFSSTRGNFGNADLLKVSLVPEPEPEEEEIIEEEEILVEEIAEEIIGYPFEDNMMLFGYVQDGINNKYIPAKIEFIDIADSIRRLDLETFNAKYEIRIAENVSYRVRISAPGYISKTETVHIRNKGSRNIRRQDFKIFPEGYVAPAEAEFKLIKGEKFALKQLSFNVNSSVILPSSNDQLDRLIEELQKETRVSISVEGHTNNLCAKRYCDELSRRRAESVAEYLIDGGVDAGRIRTAGYGKRKPLTESKDRTEQKLNQRVEIRVE
jgi:outer membrane protein OmpA-like peptidoglycan-associated protein